MRGHNPGPVPRPGTFFRNTGKHPFVRCLKSYTILRSCITRTILRAHFSGGEPGSGTAAQADLDQKGKRRFGAAGGLGPAAGTCHVQVCDSTSAPVCTSEHQCPPCKPSCRTAASAAAPQQRPHNEQVHRFTGTHGPYTYTPVTATETVFCALLPKRGALAASKY